MPKWTYVPDIGAEGESPVYLRIARTITGDIQTGRLKAGDRLPGTRSLAELLGVHRNTVIAAFDELAAQGWIETRPAGGSFITHDIPASAWERRPTGGTSKPQDTPITQDTPTSAWERRPRFGASNKQNSPITQDTPTSAWERRRLAGPIGPNQEGKPLSGPIPWADPQRVMTLPPGTLALASGMPDLRLVPVDTIARAYRRAMRLYGRQVLAYGDPRGHDRLRAALAGMLSALRGLAIGADDVQITRGSQMAVDLVSRALFSPGDIVAVEELGYRPAWEAMRMSGATLIPVPVDESGLRMDELARLADREPRLRAAYVTPHHQYPTTRVMAPGRRMALLELASRKGLTLIEDDYDFEFHYEGKPVLPLASADRGGNVVYIGTLSKILAPGLRLGFLVAPRPILDRVAAIRLLCDRQGDLALEAAVADLIDGGELQRHAQRMRKTYRARRDALAAALTTAFGDRLNFVLPAGGMALWATAGTGIDVEAWALRGADAGVMFSAASRFAFEPPGPPSLRLGFAPLDEEELREAVRRMAKALG